MNLSEKINADFMTAFKSGIEGRAKKNFLGVIKGEIQLLKGKGIESTDENVLPIIKKMEKSLNDAIENGDVTAENEMTYLKPYLPEMMNEDKVREIVTRLVTEGKNNVGLIMKEFSTTYKGQADNRVVSQIAKEALV